MKGVKSLCRRKIETAIVLSNSIYGSFGFIMLFLDKSLENRNYSQTIFIV